jgi:pantetheine-phosphate adenylyltransferase
VKTAIYPGSFDPWTLGHQELLFQALGLFDRVVVLVARHRDKSGFLPLPLRMTAIGASWAEAVANAGDPGLGNRVEVVAWEGLTYEYARQNRIGWLVRGVRGAQDLPSEQAFALANRQLCPGLETALLLSRPESSWISSSLVRELYAHRGDLTRLLPARVIGLLPILAVASASAPMVLPPREPQHPQA